LQRAPDADGRIVSDELTCNLLRQGPSGAHGPNERFESNADSNPNGKHDEKRLTSVEQGGEALDLLCQLGLLRQSRHAGSWAVHAAAARYATHTTLAEASDSGERSLFDLDQEDQ
jgi:hypothetical protein